MLHINARQKFLHREGLGQVIITTSTQSAHAIGHTVPSGEEDHRHTLFLCAHGLDNLKAIHAGHVHIKDHDIKGAMRRSAHGIIAIVTAGHFVAGLLQAINHLSCQFRIIFSEEQVHRGKLVISNGNAT